jgi:hypothetical protein
METDVFLEKIYKRRVLSPNFVEQVTETCKVLKPYLDYLNVIFFDHEEPDIQLL